MNNIHEKDWAEESWGGHSGMSNYSDYSIVEESTTETAAEKPENTAEVNSLHGNGQ